MYISTTGCIIIVKYYLFRSKALALLYVCGRIGGGSAPWIAQGTRRVHDMAPFIILGCLPILSGIACCLLMETRGQATRETIER